LITVAGRQLFYLYHLALLSLLAPGRRQAEAVLQAGKLREVSLASK
jgi:hypothetical protein